MSLSLKAMEDEKVENSSSLRYGESAGTNITRGVLWKLDVR
jgi:hypothetical protein